MPNSALKAVIFDIGGVVVKSPLIAIAAYEKERGLPPNYINNSIVRRGRHGAWQKFERGEMTLLPFYDAFGRELSDTANGNPWYAQYCQKRGVECPPLPTSLNLDGRELFGRMMRDATLDDDVVHAIRTIRAVGRWRIIALTNNYAKAHSTLIDFDSALTDKYPGLTLESELQFLGWDDGAVMPSLKALFDDFVDSSEVGMRKPEPAFYLLACERNHIKPNEAVFLDDLGLNLKVARELGMETIHVPIGGSLGALKRLEGVLGIELTRASERAGATSKL
ncbi:HAD-like protein [Amylostereum chailletii]|nr:HAD-like protein [Amylostereum chailletii]